MASTAAPPSNAVAAAEPVSLPERPIFKRRSSSLKTFRRKADLQQYMDDLGRNLNFSVDESIDGTVISVRDAQTQELVRQIPGEK